MSRQILIIGKPHSGKTTFLAQLYGRLETGVNEMKLYESVANLTPIIEALKCLAAGEEVKATPTDRVTGIILPISRKGEKIDVYCPDYGGEQINHIIENREVSDNWIESIMQSDNWLLFIRPSNVDTSFDLSNKTLTPESLEKVQNQQDEYTITDQSAYIELLQILLYLKGHDAHTVNTTCKLTIVLTCWDEVRDEDYPYQKLQRILPLFTRFIEGNWIQENINVVGMSALGFSLKEGNNREKFLTQGPENFGYLVLPDGSEVTDITQLISLAI